MCGLLSNVCQKSNIVVYLVRGFLAILIKSNSMYPVIRLLAMFVKSKLVVPRAWISSKWFNQIQHCVLIIFPILCQ